jgi:IS30 family transposase
MAIVEERLLQKLSPEQVSGRLEREGILSISHECIYQHIYRDKKAGGELFRRLRVKCKNYRKRRNGYERRGKLVGKRSIEERPPIVESRSTIGHWEADTVMGKGSRDCILTLVERMTGYSLIGKLGSRTVKEVNRRARRLISRHRKRFFTITADNGTEFHGHKRLEKLTGVEIYFANPHQSWERGTNENTNGLIRQYIPKGRSMAGITQIDCNRIARELNDRPRKRLDYQSPNECYNVALQT